LAASNYANTGARARDEEMPMIPTLAANVAFDQLLREQQRRQQDE